VIQLSDMVVKFLTTRATVRRNLSHDHVTALVTTNPLGHQMPPYLLFPGLDISAVPQAVMESDRMFGNFAENGWMDATVFQAWMVKFVDFVTKRKTPREVDDYTLLLVDGHGSRMDCDTLLTAACNRILVLCGLSSLTNIWQQSNEA
jgi:DDE superfamily endonuclease